VEEAMNSKVLFAAVFAALVAAFGCVATPTAVDSPTAYAPPTEPSGDGVIEGMALVEDIDILILESFPVQVNVVARGNLPDGCTTINEVIQERDGNTFRVTITTVRPVGMVCTEALVPFEKVIALDVYGLPAGVYTVDVNGVGDTFELTVDNMPAESPAEPTAVSTALPTAPPALGSIGGLVWHDLCKVPYETVAVPPEGCVMLPGGGLVANGLLEAGEPGIAGVVVMLGTGTCPSTGLATANTDANGMYTFAGLSAGTYCVSVDALGATNETILIPGGWTYPNEDGAVTVTIGAGEDRLDVNFGWDYQFLP
jgi:inhibitor of cysteine peptidase